MAALRNLAFVAGGAMQGLGNGMVKDVEARRETALQAAQRAFQQGENEKTRTANREESALERTSREKMSSDNLAASKEDRAAAREERRVDRNEAREDRKLARDDNRLYREEMNADRDADRALREKAGTSGKAESDTAKEKSARRAAGLPEDQDPKFDALAGGRREDFDKELSEKRLKVARNLRRMGLDEQADNYDPDGTTKASAPGLGTQQDDDAERYGATEETDTQKRPKIGDIKNGYRFKGGDPKDEKNWVSVKDNDNFIR